MRAQYGKIQLDFAGSQLLTSTTFHFAILIYKRLLSKRKAFVRCEILYCAMTQAKGGQQPRTKKTQCRHRQERQMHMTERDYVDRGSRGKRPFRWNFYRFSDGGKRYWKEWREIYERSVLISAASFMAPLRIRCSFFNDSFKCRTYDCSARLWIDTYNL